MAEQLEAINWASMNAIASLLCGPCFDDNARKMSGRVISWINSLFMEPSARAPFGHSPVDPRTPSYSKHTDCGRFGGRDKQKTSHLRLLLAKTALKNILQTNLDLFPACIDQVSLAYISHVYFLNILAGRLNTHLQCRSYHMNHEIVASALKIIHAKVFFSKQCINQLLILLTALSSTSLHLKVFSFLFWPLDLWFVISFKKCFSFGQNILGGLCYCCSISF